MILILLSSKKKKKKIKVAHYICKLLITFIIQTLGMKSTASYSLRTAYSREKMWWKWGRLESGASKYCLCFDNKKLFDFVYSPWSPISSSIQLSSLVNSFTPSNRWSWNFNQVYWHTRNSRALYTILKTKKRNLILYFLFMKIILLIVWEQINICFR